MSPRVESAKVAVPITSCDNLLYEVLQGRNFGAPDRPALTMPAENTRSGEMSESLRPLRSDPGT
jgi:hypothetical protein